MEFFDKGFEEVGKPRKTADGYLVATVKSARTGIQEYAGYEVDPLNKHGLRDKAVVRVYRSPEEVFSDSAMRGLAHRPITNDHPKNSVNASNWRKLAVGQVGGQIASRDNKFVEVPLVLMDEGTIKDYEAGKKELSWGYTCDLDFTAGQTPDGVQYDVAQKNIRGNHLALVQRGRAGSECRIGDEDENRNNGGRKVMETVQATFDGLPYTSTAGAEAVIAKQNGLLKDAAKALTNAEAAHKTALGDKDKELAAKDAEIADLKTKVVDGDKLDAMVAERSGIVTKAKAFDAKFDPKGKTNIEIMRAVVGDAAKDKSDEYVQAAFDMKPLPQKDGKPAAANADPLATAVGDSAQPIADARKLRDEAKEANLRRLRGEEEPKSAAA